MGWYSILDLESQESNLLTFTTAATTFRTQGTGGQHVSKGATVTVHATGVVQGECPLAMSLTPRLPPSLNHSRYQSFPRIRVVSTSSCPGFGLACPATLTFTSIPPPCVPTLQRRARNSGYAPPLASHFPNPFPIPDSHLIPNQKGDGT